MKILVLYNGEVWYKCFTYFLMKKKVPFRCYTYRELIEFTTVIDGTTSGLHLWKTSSTEVNLSEFQSVVYSFPNANEFKYLFGNYIDKDINYALQEWLAYLQYRLQKFNYVINRPSSDELLFTPLSLISFLRRCKYLDIECIDYYYSTNLQDIEKYVKGNKLFCAKSNIYDAYDYTRTQRINKNYNLVLNYVHSVPILAFLIGRSIFSTVFYRGVSKTFDLPAHVLEKILILAKYYNASIGEFHIRKTSNNDFLFYYFSKNPRWHLSKHDPYKLWEELLGLLSKYSKRGKQKKEVKNGIPSFIDESLKTHFIKRICKKGKNIGIH